MVKAIAIPIFRTVAIQALFTVAAVMHVIELVAVIALFRGIFKAVSGMTQTTAHLFMFSAQLVIRFIMIKFSLAPALLRMAVVTLFAHFFFMDVITLMAVDALTRRFTV